MWCWLQWAEMTGTTIDLRNQWQTVKTVPGTIVIDARSAYDAIYRTVSSHLGLREKNSAVELLALQENLVAGATRVRWVHSLAQLADSMTKPSARDAMDLFLRRHRWCIARDPNMESAKCHKARGLDRFEASDYREPVHKENAASFAESDLQACCWVLPGLLR
jgi:glycerol-3-phosphate dehydrogenase